MLKREFFPFVNSAYANLFETSVDFRPKWRHYARSSCEVACLILLKMAIYARFSQLFWHSQTLGQNDNAQCVLSSYGPDNRDITVYQVEHGAFFHHLRTSVEIRSYGNDLWGPERFAAQSIQDVSFHGLRACLSSAFAAHWDMSFVQKHRRINCELNRLDFVNIGSCPKWYKDSEPAIAQNGTP